MELSVDFQSFRPLALTLPTVSTKLNWKDYWGTIKVRWGIGRDHYRVTPGIYKVGNMKALDVVADEKAAHCQPFIRRASDNGEYVDDRQMSQETIGRIIENLAHGILGAAHDALHPINRAQVMAAVYALSASRAHQNILVVIGHANNFMRHNLPDGKNKIEAAMRNQPVHLRRPRIVQLAFRLLVDEVRRNLAEGLDIGSPVVDVKEFLRHGPEHSLNLLGLHGGVCAKRRQNRLHPITVVFPRIARQFAGARMRAALVGRHGEHAVDRKSTRLNSS